MTAKERVKLIHYTDAPFAIDPNRRYVQTVHSKPDGLWVSVGPDWQRWCDAESFRQDALTRRYVVQLPDDYRALVINSADGMDAFTLAHGRAYPFLATAFRDHPPSDVIDWPTVSEQYDGVIIAPYQYRRRLELMWYYGWDCASGCLWNLKGVTMRSLPRKGRVRQ